MSSLFPAVLVRAQDGVRQRLACAQMMRRHDVLDDAHVGKQPDVLKRARRAEFRNLVGLLRLDARAVELDLPLGRAVDPGQHVEHGRLAGAVRPDEAVEGLTRHRHAQRLHGRQAAKPHGHVAHDEDGRITQVPALFFIGTKPGPGELPPSEQALRPEDHQQDEQQRVYHHAQARELLVESPQRLRKNGENRRAEHCPGDRADPAEHDHHDHFDRFHEVEILRVQRIGEQLSRQSARDAGERRADDEGHHLVARRVDAHGLGGNLVAANRKQHPAERGMRDVAGDHDRQNRHRENPEGVRDRNRVGEARGAADGRDIEDDRHG